VDFLMDRNLLLLFDNCEHLITSCASLAETLLKACPRLHILVSSRVRLNLPGEITYYVPSLAAPDPIHPISLTELIQYDAVRLFTERSGSYSQGFTLTAANASAVALICQRLDGIPLALELAAARSRMMTAEQIAAQLTDAFHLLVGGSQTALPRHRTLRASIEWSFSLLSRKERLLFQRLSIFSNGWGLDAAEAVCAGEEIRQAEVMDLLEGLVDHSLVIVEPFTAGEARYHLLETIHHYAYERLVESNELTMLSQRHMTYYLHLAEQVNVEIRGPRQLVWINRFEKERGNLTSALERAFCSPSTVGMGIQSACALDWYWTLAGDFILLRYFLGKVLSASADFGRTPTRARALFHAGSSSVWGANSVELHEAKACIEESLDIWRELGRDYIQEEAQCLLALGFLKTAKFNYEQGLNQMIESTIMFQKIGNTWWHAWALNLISMSREERYGDAQAVRAILQEDTILWKKAGDRWGEAIPLSAWGQFALRQGNFVEAQDSLRKGLEIFQELGSRGMTAKTLRDLGHASLALQEYDQAEMYFENYEIFAQEIGWDISFTHCALGFVALHKGDDLQAEKYLIDALKTAQESGWKKAVIFCIASFASLNVVREKPAAAACLFGAFFAQVDTNQIQVDLVNQIEIDHFLDLCQAQLEKTVFDQAWNAGCAMTLDQVATCAQESLG
jgi:predicted ATPase